MLQAKLNNGKMVTLMNLTRKEIEHLKQKEVKFYCPACHDAVLIKAGNQKLPHFAHYATNQCPASGGEGIYHEQGKFLLYRWLEKQGLKVTLEMYIPEIRQRPDIMLKINEKQIAIEYQCARISVEEILSRNKGYRSIGITPIWILGANLLDRKGKNTFTINSFTQKFIHRFSHQMPSVLYYFCPQSLQFIFLQDLFFTTKTQAIGKLNVFDIRKIHFKQLFALSHFMKKEIYSLWERQKQHFRLKPRNSIYGKELAWHQWLYLKRVNVESLPSIIYLPVSTQYRMKSPPWDWQSRICINLLQPLEIGSTISFHSIQYQLRKQMRFPSFHPLIQYHDDPIKEYLEILEKLNILSILPNYTYKMNQAISLYSHIEDAINGDKVLMKQLIMKEENKIRA
ncbi:competence protein CoiA [Oceanobacillus sp. Castelsardo]|uniref:competence protein CoiA n=1 Tax=Oceanobacillus sp. Castelsardo TaxID=1851204 RepID=UPI000838E89E|nr:competence protein CoiA family protein [Oceanobacillus sp. Castelsardo]